MQVTVDIQPGPELDAEVGERLTRQLRRELLELDVESVALLPPDRAAPEGAKGDPLTVGALVVALSASGGVFTALIETLRDWLARHGGRHRVSVTIDGDTIELDAASTGQQDQLVEAYLRRHTNG
jgi:hypothetical protein